MKERRDKYLLCFILIFSSITEATIFYFKADSLTGEVTAPGPLSILRLIILVLFYGYYFLGYKSQKDQIINSILLVLIYFLFIIFLSNHFNKSLYGFIKFSLSIMIYLPFFNLFKDKNDLKLLYNTILLSSLIYILQFILANVFRLNYVDSYVVNIIYFGGSFISVPKTLTYNSFFLIILGFYLKNNSNKIYNIFHNLIIIISILTIILYLNRSSIISFFLGIVLILFFSRKFNFILPLVLIYIVFSFISTKYEYEINKIFEVRVQNRAFTQEERYNEILIVANEAFNKDLKHFLLGTDLFASEYYNFPSIAFRATRALHTDYGIVLHGSGILGFIFYFLIFFRIYRYSLFRKVKNVQLEDDIIKTFKIFSLTMIVMAYGGFIEYMGTILNYFAILGALAGFLKNNNNS